MTKKRPSAAALLKRNLPKPKKAKPQQITDAFGQGVARRLEELQITQVPGLPPNPVSESDAWGRVLDELGRRMKAGQPEQSQHAPAVPESPAYIINRMITNGPESSPIPLNGPRVIEAALSGIGGRRE